MNATGGLSVLSPGLYTSVQDLGRIGFQRFGVPVSGTLDRTALRLGNALVGNLEAAAALEILGSGPSLEVTAESVRVALAGAGSALILTEGDTGIPAWRSLTLRRGDRFRIALGAEGVCACLAIEGGVAGASVLGSASTYARGVLGGIGGRALQAGDHVSLPLDEASQRAEQRLPAPPPAGLDQPIRVVLGPQHDRFTEAALASLVEAEFCISPSSDRMGMRLDGPGLDHRAGWDIVSDAIATGAIQVPGSGQPILLLADHQTTGGYPKIATVISADLDIVGRRRPGQAIRFVAVSVEKAEALARAAAATLAALIASIEPAPAAGGVDLDRLYAGNLISGVVTATE
jgi:biotin-dependent carboxylase-like uncharacterized protein